MKKRGCFLKIIIALTIVVAVILYIVQNHLDDVVINPAKKVISDFMISGAGNQLKFLKETPEKDSLKSLLKYYISNSRSTEQLTNKQAEDIINYVKLTFKDSTITKEELNYLNKLIKNALKNEE